MRVVETTVYQFDELDDSAKEKARDWYREVSGYDEWWDYIYSDASAIATLFGLDLNTRLVTLKDKKTRWDPNIFFSGFWSQGDGACFEGDYRYAKGGLKAVKEYAPLDTELHRIVQGLQDIQKKYFYKLKAKTKQHGHYNHSGCMRVEVAKVGDWYDETIGGEPEEEITQLLRDYADWIYDKLRKEDEWRNEDEQVDDNIRCNEYEFTEEGKRA